MRYPVDDGHICEKAAALIYSKPYFKWGIVVKIETCRDSYRVQEVNSSCSGIYTEACGSIEPQIDSVGGSFQRKGKKTKDTVYCYGGFIKTVKERGCILFAHIYRVFIDEMPFPDIYVLII